MIRYYKLGGGIKIKTSDQATSFLKLRAVTGLTISVLYTLLSISVFISFHIVHSLNFRQSKKMLTFFKHLRNDPIIIGRLCTGGRYTKIQLFGSIIYF